MPDTQLHKLQQEKERRQAQAAAPAIAPVAAQQAPPPQAPQGPSLEALQQEREIRSSRAGEGQQSTPIIPSAQVQEADPLANVPTEIGGVTLTPDLRQAVLEAQALTDPREKRLSSARIAGRLAARSEDGNFADDLTRGQFGAGLRGFGAGMFGIGDLAAAGGTFVNSQFSSNSLSFGEALEAQREFRRALEEDSPLTAGFAEVGGAIAGGGLVARGVRGAARVAAPRLARAVAAATTLERAAKGAGFLARSAARSRNVLRLAGAGAVAGAVTEGITEGDPTGGAVIGGIGGPVGARFVEAAGIGARAVKKLLEDPASRGLKALAKVSGAPPEEIARRFLRFQTVMGTKPALSDLLNDEAVDELDDIIAERVGSTAIAREAGAATTGRRARETAQAIRGGRLTSTARQQKAARDKRAKKQFAEFEGDPFEFTPDQVQDLLADPDLRRALPPSLKRRIDDILEGLDEDEGAVLTGLDLNDLRLVLRDRGRGAVGAERVFGELAEEVETVGRAQNAKFGQAIDEFARRSSTAEGVETGRRGITVAVSEFEAEVTELRKVLSVPKPDLTDVAASRKRAQARARLAGIRVGARSELADVARESAAGTVSVARSLVEDSGLVQRLSGILKPFELKRLRDIAQVQVRSAENIAKLTPSGVAREAADARSLVNTTVTAIVGSQVGLGGAATANIFVQGLKRLTRLSKRVTENLARDAFDPKKTGKVIAALRRAQVPEEEILNLFATSAGTGAFAAEN